MKHCMTYCKEAFRFDNQIYVKRSWTEGWIWYTKFDMATQPFLKVDMQHEGFATRQEALR